MANRLGSIIDNLVEAFSPQMGMRRLQFRAATEEYKKHFGRGYVAGENGRRQSLVNRQNKSAAGETIGSLHKMRGFARELQRNEGVIKRALTVRKNNIIGNGIRPSITAVSKADQAQAEFIWKEWAETTNCDYDGLNDIYGLQDLAAGSMDRDGECLIVFRRDKKCPVIPIRLQVLEADFLNENMTQPLDGGNYVVQGVEYDTRGRRVAFHLFKEHPYGGETFYTMPGTERIPAEFVLHLFDQERAGQVRGIPVGIQAFMKTQDLSEYEDAELIRKKIAACFTAFVTTGDGGLPNDVANRDMAVMEPGTVHYLPQGDTVQIANPPQSDGYGDYIRTNILRIAAAYDVTYESLGDLNNVNYSSGRMGWVENAKVYAKVQNRIIIPRMCKPIFSWAMDGGRMMGIIRGNVSSAWTPPRREMLDPAKEFAGLAEAIRAGLTSWQETARELGWDPEELKLHLMADKKWWDQSGLAPYCDPRFDKAAEAAMPKNAVQPKK